MAKTLTGIVSSDKADKTIVVTVHTRKTHPLYRKQYSVSKKFMAHDEKNEAKIGDKVEIVETRPQSARKRFALSKIVEKPALREDSLAAVKSEDTGAKPVRAKADESEDSEETA
jgi:small subunit ribosomal protein S17